jgi:hypothetical protein
MAFCEPACIDEGQGRISAVRIAGEMREEEIQKVLGRLFVFRFPCSVFGFAMGRGEMTPAGDASD